MEFVWRYGVVSRQSRKGLDVHSLFARRSLRRRIVALAAAYAIALGGVFASLATAGAAAAAATGSITITCHNDAGDASSPSQNDKGGSLCVDSCCVGCVMLMAALPPPPIKAIGAPQSAATLLPLPSIAVLPAASWTRSHQSRAPPLRA
jgi:hypothetical protein